MKCASCQTEVAENLRLCPSCGRNFRKKCVKCGLFYDLHANFCLECGEKLMALNDPSPEPEPKDLEAVEIDMDEIVDDLELLSDEEAEVLVLEEEGKLQSSGQFSDGEEIDVVQGSSFSVLLNIGFDFFMNLHSIDLTNKNIE